MMLETNKNYFADNREILKTIPDKSINLFLEDMPYNTTQCDWEYEVDLKEYWELRLPKLADKGLFVLTATNPFACDLINSNRKMFRYDIIWEKTKPVGFANSRKMPMRSHELILIFYKSLPKYNPIKTKLSDDEISSLRFDIGENCPTHKMKVSKEVYYSAETTVNKMIGYIPVESGERYPTSIIKFSNWRQSGFVKGNINLDQSSDHPTKKPVGLFEYLINTYTNENDIVFDGYSGSGTTAIACIRNNRQYIICENKKEYFDLQTKRIQEEIDKTSLFNSLGGRQDRISA